MSNIQDIVEEATFEFTLGNTEAAITKLNEAIRQDPTSFEAWHALSEVQFSAKDLDKALEAAETAHKLRPDDVYINTSLSRIWVERGDKEKAEHYGAQARMLGWKQELKENP